MFLEDPHESEAVSRLYESDIVDNGYVMNLTRLWAWRPEVDEAFIELRSQLTDASSLTPRELGVIVTTTASTLGDAYCSLAWGKKLAAASDAATAAEVLKGGAPPSLNVREAALAQWVRKVVKDPNGTTAGDVDVLRDAGFSEREIFEATAFAALRLAFSTVNDALGARPDRQLAETAPPQVRTAVTFGRDPAQVPSSAA